LTNRNRLSEDILRDVKEAASGYGVSILRADVKDLVFPGNLQEIMNKVLAAERVSQAKLVETRTAMEQQRLEASNEAEIQIVRAEAAAKVSRADAEAAAEASRIKATAENDALTIKQAMADFYTKHPQMVRLKEIEAITAMGANAAARIYLGFDKQPSSAE
jgi:regulator of protease activity HflC (stomatin/prohibitin superfamily)